MIKIINFVFIQVNFNLRPGKSAVSFLCEFDKKSITVGLNLPGNFFKEMTAGTQYWSRVATDKVPKNLPNNVI